jgi:hypothetical protein
MIVTVNDGSMVNSEGSDDDINVLKRKLMDLIAIIDWSTMGRYKMVANDAIADCVDLMEATAENAKTGAAALNKAWTLLRPTPRMMSLQFK